MIKKINLIIGLKKGASPIPGNPNIKGGILLGAVTQIEKSN
jgi:hypothetical protein